MAENYYSSLSGTIDTVDEVRGLHRRSGDFLNVSEPPVQTLIQLLTLEDTIVVNGSVQLRQGEFVEFYGLTRVQLDNHGIKDYLIPTEGYEVFNEKGRVSRSCNRRPCSADSQ